MKHDALSVSHGDRGRADRTCPCCGWPGLEARPYAEWTGQVPEGADPPYDEWLGTASYEVCRCCGFEFGNDDNPGTAPPVSFDEYRHKWAMDGCRWFVPDLRPPDWSLDDQLRGAGYLR